jgi:hypothetical protein
LILLSVAGLRDVGLGVLAELSEEFMDAGDDGLVAFDFARPAAFGGVLDELLLACQANPEAGGVLAGGEELRAAQVEIKMSR